MKITALKIQVRDKNRVNVFVDGAYSFSLDITQVAELGIKSGTEFSEAELQALKDESQFGKLYTRTLEYSFVRPRSIREIKDYLYRKTRSTRTKTGELKPGVSVELTQRVFDRLLQKGYVDDEKFARFWIENRNLRKGTSMRVLQNELRAKGVATDIIQPLLAETDRSDDDEIQKVAAKAARRYSDRNKFTAYLMRKGFSYDIVSAEVDRYFKADSDEWD